MAKPKSAESDFNTGIAVLVQKATGSKPVKGEDLIRGPKLKKAFREAKKRAAKRKP